MDNSQEILTPKNKFRCLGLKRSIQRTTALKTPQSDAKIGYKSLQDNVEVIPSPSTPCLSQTPLKTTACTTTRFLPYRMSLSRRIRDNYKKKKLEFAVVTHKPEPDIDPLHKHTPEPDTELLHEHKPPNCRLENKQDLLEEIESKEKLLNTHQNHQAKVNELKNVISVWKEAFKASLEELSLKIQPKMETEDLIARLGIQPDMIEYT